MRQVVLDTETTGLEVEKGHRVIEIGCVELINRRRTGNTYHQFVNPERAIDEGAAEVHGITSDQLADKPKFQDVIDSLLDFIGGAELIIHNADFDAGFLNNEFQLLERDLRVEDCCEVVDSLTLARQMHPGQRNSLDALCKRYHVDNSSRDLHGALLDAQLLADVYLAMTGGQGELGLDRSAGAETAGEADARQIDRSGLRLVVNRASAGELEAHDRFLEVVDEASETGALWRQLDS